MNNRIDPFDELAAMFLTAPQPAPPHGFDSPAMPSSAAHSTPSAEPMVPAAHNRHAVMTELLIVGHLPVRAGLWLVPYADLLARQLGTVALIRLDGQEPTLQLLRAPEAFATAPLRMPLQQTIMDLSACVDLWMLRGGERLSADDAIDCHPDRITILSSADEAAVVAAYQTIKDLAQAAEHPQRTLPAIGMAMVGCDQSAADAVLDRLNRTTVSFLGVEVKQVALLPRMDAGIKCTRYVTFGQQEPPGVLQVRHWIEESKTSQSSAATSALPFAGAARAAASTVISEQPSVIGRITPPPETFVHDARRILRSPGGEFAPPAAPTNPPSVPSVRAPLPSITRPAAAVPPAAQPPAPAPPHMVVTPAEREELLNAIAPGISGVSGAKLPPKVVMQLEHKRPTPQRPVIEPDDRGQPIPLARFVSGLNALPLRPPGHERIEIAVDATGRLHLLARETGLRELPVVEQWAFAHRELLAMACPTLRIDPAAGRTVCHVFTAEPATLADLHGSEMRLHVLAPVTVGDKTAWFAAPLNVVH